MAFDALSQERGLLGGQSGKPSDDRFKGTGVPVPIDGAREIGQPWLPPRNEDDETV